MTLSEVIRKRREARGASIRAVVRGAGISAAYLCDIERGRRVPSDRVLQAIARHLELNFEYLANRTGRLKENVKQYMRERPFAGELLREIAHHNFDDDELMVILNHIRDLRPRCPDSGG